MYEEPFNWDVWWNSTQKFGYNMLGVIQNTTEEDIEFKLAIPGLDKTDIELILSEDNITVGTDKSNEFIDPFWHEFSILSYNKDSLKYDLVNGVLTIKLEKKEEFKPKKLEL